jgi:hypothetical protein
MSAPRPPAEATEQEQTMRSKATFLAGFATGYVLGSRAGRARYEQIRQAAKSFASNPTVQSTASSLQHQAGEALTAAKDKAVDKVGPTLQDKRPTWMGGQHDLTTSNQPAGSNGHGV